MLKQRILTTLIIAPIFAGVTIWANNTVFCIFWAVLVALAAREWARLIGWRGGAAVALVALTALVSAAGMSASASLGVAAWHTAVPVMSAVACAALWWLIAVPLCLRRYARDGQIPLPNGALAAIGCILLVAFSLAVMACRARVGGAGLFGLFVLIWCADIGAYFCGRRFGKHPLAPAISPKKTREGFWGGWLCAMLLAVLYYVIVKPPLTPPVFFLATALVLAYATVGDLFESVLKRRCGLKDSGAILPGHGGVLDRIDSWLPAMVLWACAFFFSTVLNNV